jgi:hypothetical protein
VLFNIYTPHPGTEGYRRALSEGLIDEYTADLENFLGEPVGVPTLCRALKRRDLQTLKAMAYLRYYTRRDPVAYSRFIETYEREIALLSQSDS